MFGYLLDQLLAVIVGILMNIAYQIPEIQIIIIIINLELIQV